MTADGRQVTASEDENSDLFWGMRGAGPNFGVVTAFELRLHEVGPTLLSGMVLFPIERAHDVAAMYRELVATGPDEAAFLAMYFTVAEPAPDYPPEIADWLRGPLGIGAGMTVVDLGAGTGKFTPYLMHTGAHVLAVEPVVQMLAALSAT